MFVKIWHISWLDLSYTSKRTANEWLGDALSQLGALVWESTLRSFRCTARSPLIPTPLTRLAFREQHAVHNHKQPRVPGRSCSAPERANGAARWRVSPHKRVAIFVPTQIKHTNPDSA